MRVRKLFLGLSMVVLALGLLLFSITTVRETRLSRASSVSSGGVSTQHFQYSGVTLTPDNPPEIIVGSTGTADLILLKTHWRDFSDWVCHELQIESETLDCRSFGGGDINSTILYSYLQTHQSQIAYSQTIANQNVTLDYRVTTTTDLTIALVHLGQGIVRYYWEQTKTNRTVSYPLLGYTESPGVAWSLPNISIGLTAAGTIGLLFTLIQLKSEARHRPKTYQGPLTQKCPECGHENLSFAEKCGHCGRIIRPETLRVEAPSN